MRYALLAGTLLVVGASIPTARAEGAPGDLWEITSQMSMEGMPIALPANKVKVCAAKEWKEPPGSADPRMKCTNSDFRMDGAGKATWKVTCAGPPAMTGEGELTRDGADAWSGTIKFAASEGSMNLKLDGRRLGDCEKPQ
jgi:hypothetical protein